MAIAGPVVASGYIVLPCHEIGYCRPSCAIALSLYRVQHSGMGGRQGIHCTVFTRVLHNATCVAKRYSKMIHFSLVGDRLVWGDH